jgi:hypothetical protein
MPGRGRVIDGQDQTTSANPTTTDSASREDRQRQRWGNKPKKHRKKNTPKMPHPVPPQVVAIST